MTSPESDNISYWGILGGTFDPVHLGHTNLAGQIIDKTDLSKIIIVPSYQHPFKKTEIIASFESRYRMLKLAFSGSDYIISTIEKDKELSGYTIDTIRALKSEFPRVEFSYIIGYDILAELPQWHQHEQILEEVSVLVGQRESDQTSRPLDAALLENKNINFVDTDIIPVSSTESRQKLNNGMNLKEMQKYFPEAVAEYIKKEKLYR